MKPAIEQWNKSVSVYPDLDLLRKSVSTGRVEEPIPRGLLWKVLLVYGTTDQSKWSTINQKSRQKYQELRHRYDIETNNANDTELVKESSDPLSESFNTTASSSDAKLVIEQDVERTFPEMGFFRSSHVQEILARILYIYSQEDSSIGYRQGMHELVAPVLWVMSQEDDSNVEADTYMVFEAIMQRSRDWYKPAESSGSIPEIVLKSQRIQEDILRATDPQIYELLTNNQIEPQIWGIRYIRLLFGRELGFHKTLELWDALFAADDSLALVDYICAVMVIRVRTKLLSATIHSDLLATMLRYPAGDEPPHHYVVNALYLRRNRSQEGGQYVAKQYAGLFDVGETALGGRGAKGAPHSPRLNFDSLMGAAKNVSKNWDMDKLRDAIEETRKRAFHSPTASTSAPLDTARDMALAESLSHSLQVLEKLNTTSQGAEFEFALEGIRHVKECLLNPERPAIVFSPSSGSGSNPTNASKPLDQQSNSSIQDKTRTTNSTGTPTKKESERLSSNSGSPLKARSQTPKKSLSQPEYSWMLGDVKSSPNKARTSTNSSDDPFAL